MSTLPYALLFAAFAAGCGGGTLRSEHPDGADTLRQRAGALLADALRHPETRRDALVEVRLTGTAAMPWIQQLLDDAQLRSQERELYADLLHLAAHYGSDSARAQLVALTPDDNAQVTAVRMYWIDPVANRDELVVALRHVATEVRLAALRMLSRGPLEASLHVELSAIARNDPAAAVRAAALEAMARQGAVAIPVLVDHLTDSDQLPRSVAMTVLAGLDCARAHGELAATLAGPPSHAAMDAVRALSRCAPSILEGTVDCLRRGLQSELADIRASAATAADSLAWQQLPPWLLTALQLDPQPTVRLALAAAILPTHPSTAHRTLHELMAKPHTMVSVQAAILLARTGNNQAVTRLREGTEAPSSLVRQAAARGLMRLGTGHRAVSRLLDDAEPRVRLAAAGALLAAL